MNVYIITIDGKIQPNCYTSLKEVCSEYDICYESARKKGKRSWQKDNGNIIVLIECQLERIKGRGGLRTKSIDNQEH